MNFFQKYFSLLRNGLFFFRKLFVAKPRLDLQFAEYVFVPLSSQTAFIYQKITFIVALNLNHSVNNKLTPWVQNTSYQRAGQT